MFITYFITALLFHLNYAQFLQLFHHEMEDYDGWDWEGVSPSFSALHCDIGQCIIIHRDTKLTYNGINTTGYHDIHMQYVITPDYMEGNDYCEVLYSVNGIDFTSLSNYTSDLTNMMQWDQAFMGTDADNQDSISIRFQNHGFGVQGADDCVIDEVYVWGIPNAVTTSTLEPTSNPTSDPTTQSPTNYPTSYPTTFPTRDPTIDPTKDPTSNPTFDPTEDPTFHPTNDPTKDPTFLPTSDPIIYSTLMTTQDPMPDLTETPTGSQSVEDKLVSTTFTSPQPTQQPIIDSVNDSQDGTSSADGGAADLPTKSPTLPNADTQTNDSDPAHSILSDEYLLANWYYLLIIGVVFICCLLTVIICCLRSDKDANLESTDEKDPKNQNGADVHRVMSKSITNTVINYETDGDNDNVEMGQIVTQASFPSSMPPSPVADLHSTPMGFNEYQNNGDQQQNNLALDSANNARWQDVPSHTMGGEQQAQYPNTDDIDLPPEEHDPDEDMYDDVTDTENDHANLDDIVTDGNTIGGISAQTPGDQLNVIGNNNGYDHDKDNFEVIYDSDGADGNGDDQEYEYYYEDEEHGQTEYENGSEEGSDPENENEEYDYASDQDVITPM